MSRYATLVFLFLLRVFLLPEIRLQVSRRFLGAELFDDFFRRRLAAGSSGWLRAGLAFFASVSFFAGGIFGEGGPARADAAGLLISERRLRRGCILCWLPAAVLPEAGGEAPLRVEAGWRSAALRCAVLPGPCW